MENLNKVDNVVLFELFTRLDDKTLAKICSTNSKYRNFCNSSATLWKNRLLKFLGKYYSKTDPGRNVNDIIDYYKKFSKLNWRDYYITTMSWLDDYFIGLKYKQTDREDINRLVEIMVREPFYRYIGNLYENVSIDEKIYANLDETDKRWLSPDVMIFHILIGNIKNEENIKEILRSDRLVFSDLDIILNSLFRNYNYNPIAIRYLLQYYEKIQPELDEKDKIIVQKVISDLKETLDTLIRF